MWGAAKAVPCGKFIALNAYARKVDRSQINSLNPYLKKLEGEKKRGKINLKQAVRKGGRYDYKREDSNRRGPCGNRMFSI